MKIAVPEQMFTEKVRKGFEELGYRVLGKKEGMIILEGVFSLQITADLAGMGVRKFADFCKKVVVEGGTKVRKGGTLFIEPLRTRRITIRLSADEYQALMTVARERGYSRWNLSTFFRDSLITSLLTRLEMTGRI
ncbi:MAG: hypothetical protein ACTSXC_07085 [Candidatus Freyarchaeota archaeon]